MLNKYSYQQKGFSLFLVLVLMLVIAFLVIITNQSSNTEMRSSTNEADRKVALARAEEGLSAAETRIQQAVEKNTSLTFNDSCQGGNCAPVAGSFDAKNVKDPFKFGSSTSTIEAWKRCSEDKNKLCQSGKTVLDSDSTAYKTADRNTRYIIEYLGTTTEGNDIKEIFRITSKAIGDNEDTNVVLQSYVELTR